MINTAASQQATTEEVGGKNREKRSVIFLQKPHQLWDPEGPMIPTGLSSDSVWAASEVNPTGLCSQPVNCCSASATHLTSVIPAPGRRLFVAFTSQ